MFVVRFANCTNRGMKSPFTFTLSNWVVGPAVGVYVLRRDTAQRLPALVGGRLFPGVQGRADFHIEEQDDELHVGYRAADGLAVEVDVGPPGEWSSRLFADAGDASRFFEGGACGFSADRRGCLEGIEMVTDQWSAAPVSATARSTFFEDATWFSPGSVRFDSALIMRDLPVTWRVVPVPGGASRPAVEIPLGTP